jgi:hypothetical protein
MIAILMGKQKFRQCKFAIVLALVFCLGLGGSVHADTSQSSSTNYSISGVQIGGNGSAENDCSSSYCAQEEVGDTVDGSASSSSYSAQFGADTTDTPLLEVIVDGGTQELGTLEPTTTATASFGVKVRSYLSNGYAMYITGSPPSQGEHTLTTLDTSCPCTSQPGTEQFGINLVANSSPSIGTDPLQVPSSSYGFGTAEADYDQSNLFKYHSGDEIGNSPVSTGETDYTISMIMNVSNVTPGGHYTSTFNAVVVPSY